MIALIILYLLLLLAAIAAAIAGLPEIAVIDALACASLFIVCRACRQQTRVTLSYREIKTRMDSAASTLPQAPARPEAAAPEAVPPLDKAA